MTSPLSCDLHALPVVFHIVQPWPDFPMSFFAYCRALRYRSPAVAFAALLLFLCPNLVLPAQAEEPTGRTFEIPEDLETPEKYFKFVEELANNNEPTDRSEAGMKAYQIKLARTVVLVVDKMLALKPTKQELMQVHFFRLQALRLLSGQGEPNADERFAKAIEKARRDPSPDVQAVGMKFLVENGFSKWAVWGKDEKQGLISSLVEFFEQNEPDLYQVDTLMTIVSFLDQMQDQQFAKPMLAELTPHFSKSKDEDVLKMVKKLEGIARRLDLPGKPMELTGELFDGSQLDWKSYRGKVVLVDFWATWCGPCRQETPNVLKNYRAYHEKGFEVVGISLDGRREQAESYIKQYNIPWSNLFSNNKAERKWEHPMAVHFGITGIPMAILVDRDGKVASLQARGEILGRELRRLLGEPLAQANTIDDPLVRQVDTSVVAE
jgi:thiol-disulfide isomerase/thioredoxin